MNIHHLLYEYMNIYQPRNVKGESYGNAREPPTLNTRVQMIID